MSEMKAASGEGGRPQAQCCGAPLAVGVKGAHLAAIEEDIIAGGGGPLAVYVQLHDKTAWEGTTDDELLFRCAECQLELGTHAGDLVRYNWKQLLVSREPGQRFAAALAYALKVHQGQCRKGGEVPYISHLLAVASLVMQCGGDESMAVAALLHDAVEDQPDRTSLWKIRHEFGGVVARIVDQVTEQDKAAPWAERKAAYAAQLADAGDDALLVSFADKAHNLASLAGDLSVHGASVWDRFNGSPDATVARYEELIDLYDGRLQGNLDARAVLGRMLTDIKVVRRYLAT